MITIGFETAEEKSTMQTHWEQLQLSPHFKAVIGKGFLENYALQASQDYANPRLREAKGAQSPVEIMIAIAVLKHYFELIGKAPR